LGKGGADKSKEARLFSWMWGKGSDADHRKVKKGKRKMLTIKHQSERKSLRLIREERCFRSPIAIV
jgi:hypothetical protein